MNRTLFRQIQIGSKFVAVGNFFRGSTPGEQWRLGAFFECGGESFSKRFPLEMSCVLAIGREFTGQEGAPYCSSGFRKKVVLPSIHTWQERKLGECSRLSRRLARNPEVAAQRCFVFETNGLTVWLPKFELARKLFFHTSFLVRSAFEPNGLDMAFTVFEHGDGFHIHTPPKTGAPIKLLLLKSYQNHFSWLLLEKEVKRSFESIWQCLNKEQEVKEDSMYARWRFNFMPPTSLSGAIMHVRGPFDPERNELLVWEIEKLQDLRFTYRGDIFFHHPSLKRKIRGERSGYMSGTLEAEEIEVDAEDEPTDAKEAKLIYLPIEGVAFDGQLNTTVVHNGDRASSHGKKSDDEQLPASDGESKTLGIADSVIDGSIAPGELQQLGDEKIDHEKCFNYFPQLSEIIKQIANESDTALLQMEVKPLPAVPRCSYHMMGNEARRCYLLARFRLRNGSERYLLEIDTTDNRKPMSTRIIGFKDDIDPRQCMERFMSETVKGSLRWPSNMSKHCDPLYLVRHPKKTKPDDEKAKISDWKERILACLLWSKSEL